jgi:2-polyprenyl-3-methyl-5-hydroxy-6-metoxy-1,4-benzoquinol methylase
MQVEYVSFQGRAARSEYIARRFHPLFQGKVLDVGCDRALLKPLLPQVDYFGIDISGDPDMQIDLEHVETLPFETASFDCVVCTDVLEHLNNLHTVFGELLRIAKTYVIVALPNNWANARKPIARGRGSVSHYGLPGEPPADRHKWFFGLSEAEAFVHHQLKKYAVSMRECHVTEKPRPWLIRMARRLRYPSQMRYLNRYAHTLWVVLEKSD